MMSYKLLEYQDSLETAATDLTDGFTNLTTYKTKLLTDINDIEELLDAEQINE